MTPATRAKLTALGNELSPPMMQGTGAVLAPMVAPLDPAVAITRDVVYGPDPRNRLDIFVKDAPAAAPVLVYVHGGGFIMGDKSRPGSPWFENVGQWATSLGCVGVTMTYRLAPQNRWPSGPEDMARAVRWLRANIASHGGDPDQIVLIGQSAGATHVAAYVAHPRFQGESAGVAGAVLVSGVYDATTQKPSPFSAAYYGDASITLAEARHTAGLVASRVPLLFTVSELDPREFQDQAMQLAREWHEARGTYPPLEYLAGHNHLSPAQAIGSIEDDLGPRIAAFVRTLRAA